MMELQSHGITNPEINVLTKLHGKTYNFCQTIYVKTTKQIFNYYLLINL